MLHNHLFQCAATAAGLIVGFNFYMLWSDRQIKKKKATKVVDINADEYQTMWNIPEWKKGGYEEASKKIWKEINKKEKQSAANN
jgi:hypothetical protein